MTHRNQDPEREQRFPPDTRPPTERASLDANTQEDESWELEGLTAGATIFGGRYRVENFIEKGGMGEVWLVRHLHMNRLDALKLINPQLVTDESLKRFVREAKAMATLNHPNIVAIYDAGINDKIPYISMEYISGQSLDTLLRPGVPMPLKWIAEIMAQLCDALQEAHTKGIVHRDLKPSNLMLVNGRAPGKDLKVLDLGLAKVLSADPKDTNLRDRAEGFGSARDNDDNDQETQSYYTRHGQFLGTPAYSCPEQAAGKSIDNRGDIYSIGVILYEFLTGYRPFFGKSAKLLDDHCHTLPPPFSVRNPEVRVDTEVGRVVLRCLDKDPARRYQTVRELLDAFTRAARRTGPLTIPGYQFIEKLGKGSTGIVYKGRQIGVDRIVAVKVLLDALAQNKEFITRFDREAKIAAKLSHNNIVNAIDAGEVNGYHYFVMEYVEGHTVKDDLDKHKVFEEKAALEIVMAVALALKHAHQRGVIHRNIKPANVILTEDGGVKLADLGLARLTADEKWAMAEAGMAIGTPYYISPEQVRGQVDVDIRTDIYSLGVTLYHMVTGCVPYGGDTPSEVMRKHVDKNVTFTPPDHINTKLSAGIGMVVETMMAKNRDNRYRNPDDLILDLKCLIQGESPMIAAQNPDTLALLVKGEADDLGGRVESQKTRNHWVAKLPWLNWWVAGGAAGRRGTRP